MVNNMLDTLINIISNNYFEYVSFKNSNFIPHTEFVAYARRKGLMNCRFAYCIEYVNDTPVAYIY